MTQNPFEGVGREFRRAIEDHGRLFNEEMKRIQAEIQSAMEQVKDEMQRVGSELQRAMEEFHRSRPTSTRWDEIVITPQPVDRSGKKAKAAAKKNKKNRRRRPPGSAAAPVSPWPKPKPLVDGAEAPIE